METRASIWARVTAGPGDEPQEVQYMGPPAERVWTDQLSPHLQKHKQLQDTLLQREEELARLQEENSKLRDFLVSSVKTLEETRKKLTADGRRRLKRSLMHDDTRTSQNLFASRPVGSRSISKRVCRNLTAEFCSKPDPSTITEPNLDLWVLRTLGLKDQDTIDTSAESFSSSDPPLPPFSCPSSSSTYSLNAASYDGAVNPSSSSYAPNSSPLQSCNCHCQTPSRETTFRYRGDVTATDVNLSGNNMDPTLSLSIQNCIKSLNFATTVGHHGPDESSYPVTAFCSPLSQGEPTKSSPALTARGNSKGDPYRPSQLLSSCRTDEQQEDIHLLTTSPISSSGHRTSQLCSPNKHGHIQTSSPGGTAVPQPPRRQTDLAFSMDLSSSSSVKTHSFPQGQAFIRKDTRGRWNFTWVPSQQKSP